MSIKTMSEHKAIFKSASVISFFTILSRLTGFVRDVLLANIFGTGVVAQAFFVAFKIPNVFRDILGEGAGNAAFVPVFCEYLVQKTRQEFLKLVNSLMSLVLAVSSTLTVLGIIFTPLIIQLIAPGFIADTLKFELTINLTRVLFPYLVFIVLSAYLMSVSNALKSFAMPAASSISSNIIFIIGLVIISTPFLKDRSTSVFYSGYLLAIVALCAGIFQFLVQVPPLFGKGIDFKKGGFCKNVLKYEGVQKVGRLIMPRIIGTSIYQLNIFIDTIFASLSFVVGDGAIAAIYYANRIIQFPFAIFGVALSNAALPTMSANAANQDMDKFKDALRFSLKTVFLGIIPMSVAILTLSYPLVSLIFERGSFDQYSTSITSTAVFFYGLGLVFYAGVRFFSSGFYAMQDTITPVKMSVLGLALNIVLISIFIFIFHLKIAGLALASSISAGMNFFFLYWHMHKMTGFVFGRQFCNTISKVTLASILMGVAIFALWHYGLVFLNPILRMCVVICIGAVIYGALLSVLGVREFKEFVLWLQKKQ